MKRFNHRGRAALVGLVSIVLVPLAAAQRKPRAQRPFWPTRQHTSWSLDADILGNTLAGPADSNGTAAHAAP
jgi:hypothetical protein